MSNIQIDAPLVNGDLMPFIDSGEPCKSAVELIASDDLRPPPTSIRIEIKTESGRQVRVNIPNDATGITRVWIDGSEI